MNPPLEELLANLDPDFEPEPFYSEDLEDDDEDSFTDYDALAQVFDSLAGALINH